MRWIVCASWPPVASSSRRAARPVGAQRAISRWPPSASATIARVQTVLPTPGPPVRTETREAKAPRTAAHCSSVRPFCLAAAAGASPGSWSRWGGAAGGSRSVCATASSLAQRQLAVDVDALVDQQPRRLGQHLGVGRQPEQPRRALGQLRPAAGSCCPAARPRRGRRRPPPGRAGWTPAGRRRRGRSCRRGRSRRRRPRSAGRDPRAGPSSSARRSGRGSAPPGGRGRAARAGRGGRGSPRLACQDSVAAVDLVVADPAQRAEDRGAGSAAIVCSTSSPCSSTSRSARAGPMWRSEVR